MYIYSIYLDISKEKTTSNRFCKLKLLVGVCFVLLI